eukprot:TRINITY_DN22073_c0_g1_i1.p1 TRINITY_DN22073_c0_g1~~TRINITY_DN22073_c0_g1_i1.p1  ORF type:complete len:273 (-),score=10.05 TRINITY_DN22073_c0_g1_i1:11-829(-)
MTIVGCLRWTDSKRSYPSPLPPSFGILAMSLNWTKQLEVLNKFISDWRWKAAVAKVDAAQLKTSVVDYLLPRMDIGLVHGGVSEKMCRAWMSTIIHTICERASMSNTYSLNRMAFCLLADIPDVWMRTQTTRVTNLFVNINTKYCQSGKTTIARLCAFVKRKPAELCKAITEINAKKVIKVSSSSRISSTLKYLRSCEMKLTTPTLSDPRPPLLALEIQKALAQYPSNKFIAYTDGSTLKAKGGGIFITDTEQIGRAVQQECRDRSRMPSSA